MKMNVWFDFQKSPEWALTKQAKPIRGNKALRKAFLKVIDEDVYPAAVFFFTGKHISKKDLVQLKMENELKEVCDLVQRRPPFQLNSSIL